MSVCLSVCLSVCQHDNSWTSSDIITTFSGHRSMVEKADKLKMAIWRCTGAGFNVSDVLLTRPYRPNTLQRMSSKAAVSTFVNWPLSSNYKQWLYRLLGLLLLLQQLFVFLVLFRDAFLQQFLLVLLTTGSCWHHRYSQPLEIFSSTLSQWLINSLAFKGHVWNLLIPARDATLPLCTIHHPLLHRIVRNVCCANSVFFISNRIE